MCVGLRILSFITLWINCWILNGENESWTINHKNDTHLLYNNMDIHYDSMVELIKVTLMNAKQSNNVDRIDNILQVFDDLDIRRRLVDNGQLSQLQTQLDDVKIDRENIRNELNSLKGNDIDVMAPFNNMRESLEDIKKEQQTKGDELVNAAMQPQLSSEQIGKWQNVLHEQKKSLERLLSIVAKAQKSRNTFIRWCGFVDNYRKLILPRGINPIKNTIVLHIDLQNNCYDYYWHPCTEEDLIYQGYWIANSMDESPTILFNVVGNTLQDPQSIIDDQIMRCVGNNDVQQVYIVKFARASHCNPDKFRQAIEKVKKHALINIDDRRPYITIMEYSWKQMLLVMNTHSSINRIPWGIIRYHNGYVSIGTLNDHGGTREQRVFVDSRGFHPSDCGKANPDIHTNTLFFVFADDDPWLSIGKQQNTIKFDEIDNDIKKILIHFGFTSTNARIVTNNGEIIDIRTLINTYAIYEDKYVIAFTKDNKVTYGYDIQTTISFDFPNVWLNFVNDMKLYKT